ncbi:MAG: hypothetical protein ACMXYG_06515 [Candidatus Woesearchaeota archaeon]
MNLNSNCIICKGRDPAKYCNKTICPIIVKNKAYAKARDFKVSEELTSDSPAVFIGHYGYPHVNVGILTPPEKQNDTWLYDAPTTWGKNNFQIPQVIDYRSALINSRFKSGVKDTNRMVEIAQEVSQSLKPVDLEIGLERKPKLNINFDPFSAPTGPNAGLKMVKITANTKVDRQIEKRVSDKDLLSNQAIIELWKKGYDENFLSKLLSVGNLGIAKDRKLVPTRWSITAVDDNVGKEIIETIKDYEITENTLFFGNYLGNYYIIMMFEDVWEYELFEMYTSQPKNPWSKEGFRYATDYEGYEGRKTYAEETAGGYYAARLPILNYLQKEKKQASCLVFRFITGEYTLPLGVWVVREATKKTIDSKKHLFETKEQMINYAKFIAKKKFNIDIDDMLKESKLYNKQRSQLKLMHFSM